MNWRKIIKGTAAGLILIVLLYMLFRNYVLHFALDKMAARLEKRFGLELVVEKSSFNGLATVEMNSITITPASGDTLLYLDSLSATPSVGSLLLLNVRLRSLEMKNGFVRLVCKDSICNFSSLFSKSSAADSRGDTLADANKNYASLFYRFFSTAFNLAPQNAMMSNLDMSFVTDSFLAEVSIPVFSSSSERMEGELEDVRQNRKWKMEGTFDQDERKYAAVIYPLSGKARLPLLKELFSVTAGFDTLRIALTENNYTEGIFTMSGRISSDEFSLYHKKISNDTVLVAKGEFNYDVTITPRSVSLDSTSTARLNKISLHPFFRMSAEKSKVYELAMRTDTTPATEFFSSLPPGVFDETRGIQADGKLQYVMRFKLNAFEPDSVMFDSQMRKIKFRLRKSGRENLFRMNEEFMHTVYEYGRPFRSFMVGPSNPDFTPAGHVAQDLKNAILTSEDGSFFFHNGFNEEAFRKSIAENYRKGKFVRGGSTITMQLVKNVFLSRHKTIARKAEEALIVWLLESNNLTTKERMFEVYLNIIELGPGVYGVGEASRFYFDKKPSELTLSESIFLASLLPHPKWFKYSFDTQGNLKSYLADYYRVVSNFLLRRNLIPQSEYDKIVPNVELKGIARGLVVPSDTIPVEEED
jgi:hypothetical protein